MVVYETVRKTRNVRFPKFGTFPIWVSVAHKCYKCMWSFEETQDTECIVAVTEKGDRYFFHERCFVPDKKRR